MAGSPLNLPVVGAWPFGFITTTAGTPVPITKNIGAQVQKPGGGGTALSTFSQKVQQLIFMAPTANTGAVYILKRGYSKTQTNGIIAILNPGQILPLPYGYPQRGGLLPDDFYVDITSGSTDGVYVTGMRGD